MTRDPEGAKRKEEKERMRLIVKDGGRGLCQSTLTGIPVGRIIDQWFL